MLDTGETPLFRCKGVTKVYGSGHAAVHALRGVDLEVPRGELVVMLGPSGSGKSTMLNILGGLDTATSGKIWFKDDELTAMSEEALTLYRRRHVGFVFQLYNLMPSLTALENVELVAEISENPMDPEQALALVGLEGRKHHFPAQLSGGEQQRVAIARAITKQPEVLFCDEPTGALDSETGRVVLRVLTDINQETNATVLLITHARATAQIADRVIKFADGRISEITENSSKVEPEEIRW